MAVFTFLGFAVLYWAFAAGLAGSFGLAADPGLVLIIILTALGPVLHLLSPFTSFLSRVTDIKPTVSRRRWPAPNPMISALTKLARDNLSTLTPDRFYALFYYSTRRFRRGSRA